MSILPNIAVIGGSYVGMDLDISTLNLMFIV
jgi:hypothetical protein